MVLAGRPFVILAEGFLAAHVPVAVIEGLVTGSVVVLLRQVWLEVLRAMASHSLVQEVGDG